MHWPARKTGRAAALLAVLLPAAAAMRAETAPRVFQTPPALLLQARERQDAGVLRAVRAEADRDLTAGPWTVMEKSTLPPSGDKHDYLSLSRYAWPNPKTPEHLPWVIRDGQVNPEINRVADHEGLEKMSHAAYALALGWYVTGERDYAERAALLLRAWFLNPATRMNPNLKYSGSVPGVNGGLGSSVIDARELPYALDAVGLLAGSPGWSAADDAAMSAWCAAYFDWLQQSAGGQHDAAAKNNHGVWYDEQAVSLALFLGLQEEAHRLMLAARARIGEQIRPDGTQPQELARTRPYSYSIFNVFAFARLAEVGEQAGVDLWGYTAEDGASLRGAVDYLLPYVSGAQKWPGQSVKPEELASLRLPLLQATLHVGDAKYQAAGRKLGPETAAILIFETRLAGKN